MTESKDNIEPNNKSEVKKDFEPKILGFLCNWCSYAGADLAGVSRLQYPPNIRVIRVMCSGRVDPVFVADALLKGIDGILILGCHLGDCHYGEGNYEAKANYEMLQILLKNIELEKRVELNWVSAAEGTYFSQIVSDFTENIRTMGPSPLSPKNKDFPEKSLISKMEAIKRVVSDGRIRKLVGRERSILNQGNVYEEKVDEDKYANILEEAVQTEYIRNYIYVTLKNNPSSVRDLSRKLKLASSEVLSHILVLRQRGLVNLTTIKDLSPIYIAIE
ncbi:MAG: hydrogenase iron-sulfur subunit [Candidatus Lokiarchaeota archaeon]|nr:hydrogenase iron-sulfur subunit [Candidatus Harpocratesius repetitus]